MRTAAVLAALALSALDMRAAGPQVNPTPPAHVRAEAERGDAQAQLAMANALGASDPAARVWALKAAEQGVAEAWFWLGYHTAGDEAQVYYRKAADLGYAEAFGFVLDNLLFRAGPSADVIAAKRYADLARALSVDPGRDLDVVDRCAEAGSPAIPPAHQPSPQERAQLSGTTCLTYRDGVGVTRNLVQYRKCLLSEDPVGNNWLAEVYANGWGVARDARLALALVCHGSDVPAELVDVVDTLYDTRTQSRLDEPFHFCEHVTSGFNAGRCSARDEALERERRALALRKITAGWPPAHVAAFERLQAAAETFFTTRSTGEIDMTGTLRATLALGEESTLRDAFLGTLKAANAGKLPPVVTFATADAALNRVYQQLMRASLDLGTVSHDSVRETQRAWLAYRDAWGAFGALHFPQRTAEQWKAWATTVRTKQLQQLLSEY